MKHYCNILKAFFFQISWLCQCDENFEISLGKHAKLLLRWDKANVPREDVHMTLNDGQIYPEKKVASSVKYKYIFAYFMK